VPSGKNILSAALEARKKGNRHPGAGKCVLQEDISDSTPGALRLEPGLGTRSSGNVTPLENTSRKNGFEQPPPRHWTGGRP